MTWIDASMIGSVAAALVLIGGMLYKFIEGRARFNQSDLELVVTEQRAEMARLTGRLDARIKHDEQMQDRLLECEKKHAEAEAKIDFMENEIVEMRKELHKK